jgi:hypothetical protein
MRRTGVGGAVREGGRSLAHRSGVVVRRVRFLPRHALLHEQRARRVVQEDEGGAVRQVAGTHLRACRRANLASERHASGEPVPRRSARRRRRTRTHHVVLLVHDDDLLVRLLHRVGDARPSANGALHACPAPQRRARCLVRQRARTARTREARLASEQRQVARLRRCSANKRARGARRQQPRLRPAQARQRRDNARRGGGLGAFGGGSLAEEKEEWNLRRESCCGER